MQIYGLFIKHAKGCLKPPVLVSEVREVYVREDIFAFNLPHKIRLSRSLTGKGRSHRCPLGSSGL